MDGKIYWKSPASASRGRNLLFPSDLAVRIMHRTSFVVGEEVEPDANPGQHFFREVPMNIRFWLAVALLGTAILRAQEESPPREALSLRDDQGRPLVHVATVRQYYPSIALSYEVAGAFLTGMEMDTVILAWDHPLRHLLVTPLLPVFAPHSTIPVNSPRTLPFMAKEGDTLHVFRSCGYRFPHLTGDGKLLEDVDTAMQAPGWFRWTLWVEDAERGDRLAVLDQGEIPPALSWYELLTHLAQGLADGRYPPHPCLQWIPKGELLSRPLRLRLDAEVTSLSGDPTEGRELDLTLRWSPIRACMLGEEEERREWEALWKSPMWTNREQGNPSLPRDPDLQLDPVLLRAGHATLRTRSTFGGTATLDWYALDGSRLSHQEVILEPGTRVVDRSVPIQAGMGFVRLRLASHEAVVPWRVVGEGGGR